MGDEKMPENLLESLYHGKEEIYLEYKADIAWSNRPKMLEIVKTILALANLRDGGIILIGVKDDGERIGLTDENYNSFSHDYINQFLDGRVNQAIQCKVEKHEHKDKKDNKIKKFVSIQVAESQEFPAIYIGKQELFDTNKDPFSNNIALRQGALYIRNKTNIGNKETKSLLEWQELIERTIRKYKKETMRRSETEIEENFFDKELTI